MRIAVIPARGGSKRIPRKNIREFCGKPMIAWPIEIAKESCLFDKIIVSTDDDEIAKIALSWGAEVPFIRPSELSDDHTEPINVISHATHWAIGQGFNIEALCCIFPTNPFIEIKDIKKGLDELQSANWAYVFTATEYVSPIFRSFRENADSGIEMFFPEYYNKRSQDLPIALHDAGQFYWGRPDAWLEKKRVFEKHSKLVLIPNWRVQDIDNEDDWIRAEMIAPVVFSRSANNSNPTSGLDNQGNGLEKVSEKK